MTNQKIIKIKDFGTGKIFAGRNTGNKIKTEITPFFNKNYMIIFDFEGIEMVTHSFIDEFVGTSTNINFENVKNNFKFKNCNENIKDMIKFVISDRVK